MADAMSNDTEIFEIESVESQAGPLAIVPIWILEIDLKPAELKTWIAIASFCGSGPGWPSTAKIATRAGVSVDAVHHAIPRLRRMRLLATRSRRRPDGTSAGLVYVLPAVDPRRFKVIEKDQVSTGCSNEQPVEPQVSTGCSNEQHQVVQTNNLRKDQRKDQPPPYIPPQGDQQRPSSQERGGEDDQIRTKATNVLDGIPGLGAEGRQALRVEISAALGRGCTTAQIAAALNRRTPSDVLSLSGLLGARVRALEPASEPQRRPEAAGTAQWRVDLTRRPAGPARKAHAVSAARAAINAARSKRRAAKQ
jgi:hypothetical protein